MVNPPESVSTAPIAASTPSEAEKPPRLTTACATPRLDVGLLVRPMSIPTTDAGPPIPRTTISATSSHAGAGPGSMSTTVHSVAVTPTTTSTRRERRSGRQVVRAPAIRPNTIVQPTNSVISAPAAPEDRPCADTSHGTPHSSVKTFIENCTLRCEKNPTRVPGRRQTARNRRPISRADTAGPRSDPPCGASRTTTSASTATSALAAAAEPKAAVHPATCSSARNGTAERICPAWHRIVVSWVTIGTRRAGNHRGSSASTATKTTASPMPTSTRPSRARGSALDRARSS